MGTKGGLSTMNDSGDTKLIWDSDNDDEVEAARDTFDKLTKKGYLAFSVKKGGEQDSLVKKFDPDMEKIILVPPRAGG